MNCFVIVLWHNGEFVTGPRGGDAVARLATPDASYVSNVPLNGTLAHRPTHSHKQQRQSVQLVPMGLSGHCHCIVRLQQKPTVIMPLPVLLAVSANLSV